MSGIRRVAIGMAVVILWAVTASAQTCPCPAEPPPGNWVGSAGLGFAINKGNTDTTNLNVSFDATYDPKKKDLWKFQGLYLRGETDGEPTVDRLFLLGRYERDIGERAFAFGQAQYLRDEFKEIDSLIATSAGFGYKLVATDRLSLSADAGAGVSWEKNPGFDVDTSAVITAGDQLEFKVTPTATITQSFAALWNADDFGDALYTFNVGFSTSVSKQIELKIELLDTYKTKPPNDLLKKNDVAMLTAIVYKF